MIEKLSIKVEGRTRFLEHSNLDDSSITLNEKFQIWTGTVTELVHNLKELLDTNIRSLMFQICQ